MALNQMKSSAEILDLYERRGERIPETKEFENLGIEDGAVFHERLTATGKKLMDMASQMMKPEATENPVPFGAEVIDPSVPLVMLSFIHTRKQGDTSKYYHRVDFQLIKPSLGIGDKITDPKYLFENCSVYAEYLFKNKQEGESIAEMGFSSSGEDKWHQHHRRTNVKYSRQNDGTGVTIKLGKEMLDIGEMLPGEAAQKEGRSQTTMIDPAQVGVMRWAVRNGYAPATPEDAKLWERVQAGDPAFYVQDYIEDGEANPDYLYWKNPKEGDPSWKEGDEWTPMVRIKFEKKFSSHEKNAIETGEGVSDAVKNVLGV